MSGRTTYYASWGNYPREKQLIKSFDSSFLNRDNLQQENSLLPYGLGRSYGDSCLNGEGILLDTTTLNRFLSFDEETHLLRAEAGVSLQDILRTFVPKGYFLPVTPGTKFVTIGGAIANDVHGKNHHKEGTFGRHVTQFELLRSTGERIICSPTENAELFKATIGGLGLTGIILWAEFKLHPIKSPFIECENIKYSTLDEFFEIDRESAQKFDYTVAWVDCVKQGKHRGRGIYMRGNFSSIPKKNPKEKPQLNIPLFFPNITLNPVTVTAFNTLYYNKQIKPVKKFLSHYEPFFYPLDAVNNWNRIYGKKGFFQYQFVIPFSTGKDAIGEIFKIIGRSKMASFLAVLKNFGDIPSPGMLSFPRPGITLALDFKNLGDKSRRLFADLDKVVNEAGGILYPAKDARMTPEDFKKYYPNWKEFEKYIDPKCSSTFWRRVTH